MPSLFQYQNSEVSILEIICPNCRSKDVGKIGVNQYYCWGCFIEMSLANGLISTHQVEEDGSLSSLDDLFEEHDRRFTM
ncbi:hypothetical protein LIT35_17400 [Peribacillus asahii]|nr:hypothetical protein [Peribacillus asahii]USK84188.1 hypothetical protein LIT35_17400 [Peribacillus asahii]